MRLRRAAALLVCGAMLVAQAQAFGIQTPGTAACAGANTPPRAVSCIDSTKGDHWGTCAKYKSSKWCAANGAAASGWQSSWGAISAAVKKGCCACGGGKKKLGAMIKCCAGLKVVYVPRPKTDPQYSKYKKMSICKAGSKKPMANCADSTKPWSVGGGKTRTCATTTFIKPNSAWCTPAGMPGKQSFGLGGSNCKKNGMGGLRCCPMSCGQCPGGVKSPAATKKPTSPKPHKLPVPKFKKAPHGAKNILMIPIDDLRPELGVYGSTHAVTPQLDAFAKTATLFKNAYVQQAVCGPSRTSFMTSRRPSSTRVYDLQTFWRNSGGDFSTIPQVFKENGYVSVGMGKVFHPNCNVKAKPWECDKPSWSWDVRPYFHAPTEDYWTKGENCVRSTSSSAKYFSCVRSYVTVSPAEEKLHPIPDSQIKDHAVETLEYFKTAQSTNDTRPFFMAVGFHKPHLPFVVAQKYVLEHPLSGVGLSPVPFAPIDMPRVAYQSWGELKNYPDIKAMTPKVTGALNTSLPDSEAKVLRQHYFAAVSQTDDYAGEVLGALKSQGFEDNTIVAVFGDHGWHLGDNGMWCKHTNFNIAARTVLMIRVPGVTHGTVAEGYAELVDVMPTFADFAGIPKPSLCPLDMHEGPMFNTPAKTRTCTEGVSLRPILTNPLAKVKTAAFSVYPRRGNNGKDSELGYSMVTIVQNVEYRYTEWVPFDKSTNMANFTLVKSPKAWCQTLNKRKGCWGSRELYDHHADPHENRNVAAEASPTLLAKLSEMLRIPPYGTGGWRKAMITDAAVLHPIGASS